MLDALGVERSDAQLVANTVERAQQTLSGLLNAALYIDHTAASEPEVATYGQQQNGTDHQVRKGTDVVVVVACSILHGNVMLGS